MATNYSPDLQKLFLEIMVSDAYCFARVQNIFDVENFHKSLKQPAKFVKEYYEKYTSLPSTQQMKADCGIEFTGVDKLDKAMIDWFMDEFESFTRHTALNRAILKAAHLIENNEYDSVEKLIKDAVQISLTRDLGISLFDDPRGVLMHLKSQNGQISTGWPTLDSKLYGGFSRGELEIFAGGSGSGKSLIMQNLSLNWITAGLNGVYLTLELSEALSSMRMYAMMSEVTSKEIFKDLDNVELKVKMIGKKSGDLHVKYLPAQSTINDIRAYIKELQVQTGKELAFICVDYLDLLMPVSAKVSPSDLFVKDKYVSEELRNLGKELNVVLVTASQLNRAAVDELEFDHSHISGGISKINTADNVFGIFTSRAMKEHGRYQLQLMKTRSSNGVGQKIDLGFNNETLRIFDIGEKEDGTPQTYMKPKNEAFFNKVKSGPPDEIPNIKAEVKSKQLSDMLNSLRKG